MANYDDYSQNEMEDAAMNKSNKWKRAAAVGGAVLGVGTAGAFAADKVVEGMNADNETPLTEEDLLSGAQSGAVEAPEAPAAEAQPEEVHVYHHQVETAPAEPDVQMGESGIAYDEYGNPLATYDTGTVDGKGFVVFDNDLNGYGDVIGYDANGDGVIDQNELAQLDNHSYHMGMPTQAVVVPDPTPEIFPEPPIIDYADNGNDHIRNDFEDEKSGEIYGRDLAENNHDYNNKDGMDYSAGLDDDDIHNDLYDDETLADNETGEDYDDSDYLADNGDAADDSFDTDVYDC